MGKDPKLPWDDAGLQQARMVIVQISDYVKNFLHDAPDEMGMNASTPMAAHLFNVNIDDPKLLPTDKRNYM